MSSQKSQNKTCNKAIHNSTSIWINTLETFHKDIEIINKNIYSELYNTITGKIKLLTDQEL
ncbi:hypothetical protein RhiirA4_398202, partial [Rhizophagus irregularis]